VGRVRSTISVVPLVSELPYEPWRERGSILAGEFRWRLGVRPLDLANWIELGPDADGPDGWIAQKAALLGQHASTVFGALDGIEPASQEVADAVVDHLRWRWPERFGRTTLDTDLHPLVAASRLVPEDLVLMVERDGRLVFGGGSVCFPNRWDLASKLGRSMAEVHEPVALLNATLESEVDRFLGRLRPERSFWRLGWGIIDVPDGYTPADGTGGARPIDPDASELFVRVERETLRRFPGTGCVLFTIRTYIAPIAVMERDPKSAATLAAAVSAMSAEVRRYKDLANLGDAVTAQLSAAVQDV